MLNDYGKSLFKPWCSVQNMTLVLALTFIAGLVIKTNGLNSSEIASWVQAIGSVAAIIGAFMIGSIQHRREVDQRLHLEKLEVQEAKNLLLHLTQDIDIHLGFLISAINGSFSSYGVSGVVRYRLEGYDLRWIHQRESMQSVDVKLLTGAQRLFLTDIKTACSFAIKVCERLGSWDNTGTEEIIMTTQLMFHKSRTDTAYKLLQMNKDVSQR
ncbi:hypothetical protein K9857_04830 [Pseudomonas sp. REP124]|uniref:hypothetical protein n=1 Tax=Pseudomonas sp. REP124 TaxID=2875731 RepID=UPI001CCDB30B|nr:hypothetical protein [Pseudomonas sp. REP124]MBZ9780876.1 hypothetical protein [Pseudomonas sp. REP124]